jgi:YidC/Oxa1 family membrane protein insertase
MFQTIFVEPLYNIFIFLIGIMPGGDVGLAILALTLLVRLIFYPAFTAQIKTQMGMQAAQPELDEINKKYKDNAQERAKRTMEVFRKYNIRPFSSILAILIQIPILFALYIAFLREGLPNIDTNLLYSFVDVPEKVNTVFLGILDLLEPRVIVLAVIVGGLQYLAAYFTMARIPSPTNTSPDKAAMHQMQRRMMLYFLPAVMVVASYTLPSAAGLYFAAGSVVSLLQEWVVRRHISFGK